jgi:hypothetical protein
MTRRRLRLLVVVLVAPAALGLAAGPAAALLRPPFYSAKPVQATVVDEATRQPVEGVVVAAVWAVSSIHGVTHTLHIGEAVTDSQGRFSLPGFGPKLRPPLYEAQRHMPYLILFKHGYVPLILWNASRDKFVAAFGDPRQWSTRQLADNLPLEFDPDRVVQESFWNGLTIELEPFRGTPAEWLRQMEVLTYRIDFDDRKRVPRLLRALLDEQPYVMNSPSDPYAVDPSAVRAFFDQIRRYLE